MSTEQAAGLVLIRGAAVRVAEVGRALEVVFWLHLRMAVWRGVGELQPGGVGGVNSGPWRNPECGQLSSGGPGCSLRAGPALSALAPFPQNPACARSSKVGCYGLKSISLCEISST